MTQPNRDTRGDDYKSHPSDSTITREVDELIKSQATDHQAWQKLEAKYKNNMELRDNILEAYKNKLQMIYKKAKKFKQVIFDRYAGMNLSYGDMLRKAKKYQKKYKFTNDEFEMFVILSMTDKSSKYVTSIPTSKIAKTLGYDSIVTQSKLNVKPDEQSIVEEIVNRYGETKPLHAQIILQSLTYHDCAPEALLGTFDEKKHNPYSYIHPVVAALFLPKVEFLDQHMLMANIGYIVKCKAAGEPIQTLPDWKLYWDMVSDPSDAACALPGTNGIVDIRNRQILQTQLWEAVLMLRQGKYYYGEGLNIGLGKFMQALENCRNAIYDAPDLTYVKDEGTILRRILSTFSVYPTYVSINRLNGLMIGSQHGFPTAPIETAGFSNITRVPMITLRLPLDINGNARAIKLEEALTQPQWFVENKVIIPKHLQIIHSNDVLFFYVGRRYQTINIARLAVPYNFTNLPMTVTGWEALNSHPVYAARSLQIMNDTYQLKSAVLVEKTGVVDANGKQRDLIVGSSALIVADTQGFGEETCISYDPGCVGAYVKGDRFARQQPIKYIPSQPPFNNIHQVESFDQKTTSRGTIFMYVKVSDNSSPFFAERNTSFF